MLAGVRLEEVGGLGCASWMVAGAVVRVRRVGSVGSLHQHAGLDRVPLHSWGVVGEGRGGVGLGDGGLLRK